MAEPKAPPPPAPELVWLVFLLIFTGHDSSWLACFLLSPASLFLLTLRCDKCTYHKPHSPSLSLRFSKSYQGKKLKLRRQHLPQSFDYSTLVEQFLQIGPTSVLPCVRSSLQRKYPRNRGTNLTVTMRNT